MEKNYLDIDILTIFVEKVLEKVRHGFVCYMTAYHNMSAKISLLCL